MAGVSLSSLGMSVTGMDTESVIKQLMTASNKRYDNTWKQKTQAEYKKADYINVYNQMQTFRDTSFNYMSQSKLAAKSAEVTDGSSSVKVTANADATVMNHSISVSQVASGVKMISSAAISVGDKTNLATQFGLSANTDLSFVLKNGSSSATIAISSGSTINDLMSQINNAGLNIAAAYDSSLDRVFLSTKQTGADHGIEVDGVSALSDDAKKLITGLKIGISDTVAGSRGTDAVFAVDNISLTASTNSVTYTGVNYTFVSTTTSALNVAVGTDIDTIISNLKTYVASYNSTLASFNNKNNETYYKDYLPLTDTEKSAMSESTATAWETRAKSGLLRHDDVLNDTISAMRSAFSDQVSGVTGKYNSAASLGFTVDGLNYKDGGTIYIDEDKLRAALEDDPDAAYKVFGANAGGTTDLAKDGVAYRLNQTMRSEQAKVTMRAGTPTNQDYDTTSSLAVKISQYSSDLTTQAKRIDSEEAIYRKKFSAMETALQKLNSQASKLISSLGS